MAKRQPFFFAISDEQINNSGAFRCDGILDMLRYDAATVIERYRGFWVFSRPENPPTTGRWASFRMTPLHFDGLDYTRGVYEMRTRIDSHLGGPLPRPGTVFDRRISS